MKKTRPLCVPEADFLNVSADCLRIAQGEDPTLKTQGPRLGDSKSSYFFIKAGLLKRHFQRREGQEEWSHRCIVSRFCE